MIRQIDASLQAAVLRACVPIIYAHWEGHVAYVAESYFAFLALRKPRYSTLTENFLLNEFYSTLRKMRHTTLSHEHQIKFLVKVMSSGERQFRQADEEIVSSRSNLRSDVLKDICFATGINHEEFQDDTDFIDKILADRRNSVAHGEFLLVTYNDFVRDSDRTLRLMRRFNNLVDNDVALGKYKRTPIP